MILVTGGTGFIGTHLLEKLVANGEAVRALVRRTRLPRVMPAGVETVYGDLESNTGITEALRGADAVIHLAGVTKALRTEDFYSGNVRATEQLVHSMAGQGIRLIHVSSLAAIGPSASGALLGEDATPSLTHYGKSKMAAERVFLTSLPMLS
jgi:nucleoside-diphosphate-sugar epimerase